MFNNVMHLPRRLCSIKVSAFADSESPDKETLNEALRVSNFPGLPNPLLKTSLLVAKKYIYIVFSVSY